MLKVPRCFLISNDISNHSTYKPIFNQDYKTGSTHLDTKQKNDNVCTDTSQYYRKNVTLFAFRWANVSDSLAFALRLSKNTRNKLNHWKKWRYL